MFDWLKNKRKKYTIRILDDSWEVLDEYKSDIIPSKDELYLFDTLQYYQIINLIHNTKGNNFITIIVKKIEITLSVK